LSLYTLSEFAVFILEYVINVGQGCVLELKIDWYHLVIVQLVKGNMTMYIRTCLPTGVPSSLSQH